MQQLGTQCTDEMCDQIISSLDLDHNGQIEWGEFAVLMADRWLRQDGETDMDLVLSLFTQEGDDQDEMLDIARSTRFWPMGNTERKTRTPRAAP